MRPFPVPKKALGQNWLFDKTTLQNICEFAGIKPGDVVLEIGPGTGSLTDALIDAGAEVTALEYDHELLEKLQAKYKNSDSTKIFVQEGDIRSYDLGNLPDKYKVVANIPYYLTANLVRKFTDSDHKPEALAILVQKEVAERLAAQPGQLSQIAIAAQFYYQVELGEVVRAEMFTPPPKVDSQVVKLTLRQTPQFPGIDFPKCMKLVNAGFSEKRKKLKTSLSRGLSAGKPEIEAALKAAKISPDVRAQELSLQEWTYLYKNIDKKL